MRTTLDIKDEVLERVKEYAAARSISQGAAVSEVLERGSTPKYQQNGRTESSSSRLGLQAR